VAATRTRLTLDTRREQLLDAGVALFATRSWEEVSIEEIAAAGGVSRGLLYHYFAGKRDYYVACLEHAVERLRGVEPDLDLPPGEQLRVGLERFFASIEEQPQMHAILRRVAPADVQAAAILERDREAFTDRVLAGMPRAGSGSPLARASARAWIGAVEAAGLDRLEHPELPAEQLVEILAQALIGAMSQAAAIDPSIELPAGLEGDSQVS
jgi:AcrR family transcriptional regulator